MHDGRTNRPSRANAASCWAGEAPSGDVAAAASLRRGIEDRGEYDRRLSGDSPASSSWPSLARTSRRLWRVNCCVPQTWRPVPGVGAHRVEWAKRGQIPSVRTPGGHRRYPAEGIRSLLQSGREGWRTGHAELERVAHRPQPAPARERLTPPAGACRRPRPPRSLRLRQHRLQRSRRQAVGLGHDG